MYINNLFYDSDWDYYDKLEEEITKFKTGDFEDDIEEIVDEQADFERECLNFGVNFNDK